MPDPYDQTPLLSLPYIQGGQAQKHVTHNEALERLDMLVHLAVEAMDAITPPSGAVEGQAWIVGAGATGVWASHVGDIAAWRGGNWLFVTPQAGWRIWDKTNAEFQINDGTAWVIPAGSVNLQNLDGVGINATSDATNRLAVSAPATLLNNDGAGHQLKINKNATTDTASLLYQTNWSGRAEVGLAGNDDLSVKVSTDGANFIEAMRIDAATGAVDMPATGTRQMIPFNYRYYLYADKRWVGPSANSGTLNAAQSLGLATEPIVDWDAKGLYIPAGAKISGLSLAGNISSSDAADLDLRIYFQHGPWGASWNTSLATTRDTLFQGNSVGLIADNGMTKAEFSFSYVTPAAGYFSVVARANAASTLGGTRSFYAAGALDIMLP